MTTKATPAQEELARIFKALGDPTRLRIFEFLRSCCGAVAVDEQGDVRPVESAGADALPTVGDVCCQVTGIDRSSPLISFHLKELRQAGLITMERRGKNFICGVAPDIQRRLAGYFGGKAANDCCSSPIDERHNGNG